MSTTIETITYSGAVSLMFTIGHYIIALNHSKHSTEAQEKLAKAADVRNQLLEDEVEIMKREVRASEDRNTILKQQVEEQHKMIIALRDEAKRQLAADVAAEIFTANPAFGIMPLLGRAAVLLRDSKDVLFAIRGLKTLVITMDKYKADNGHEHESRAQAQNEMIHLLYRLILILAGGMTEEDAGILIDSAMRMA